MRRTTNDEGRKTAKRIYFRPSSFVLRRIMKAETISIGTELLLGQITDTNAVWIAERLSEVGGDL